MNSEAMVESVRKLNVVEGDVVVVSYKRCPPREVRKAWYELLRRVVPSGARIVLMDDSLSLIALTPEQLRLIGLRRETNKHCPFKAEAEPIGLKFAEGAIQMQRGTMDGNPGVRVAMQHAVTGNEFKFAMTPDALRAFIILAEQILDGGNLLPVKADV